MCFVCALVQQFWFLEVVGLTEELCAKTFNKIFLNDKVLDFWLEFLIALISIRSLTS